MKKYYNDAFVANKNMIASFSKYGELLRLYYPLPDYRQYSDYFRVGLKINDSNIIYLHNDPNNKYNQYYTKDTNILNTEIENTYFNLKIKQTDCVMINQDLFIKKYVFENASKIDLAINFLVHAKAVSSFNNMDCKIYLFRIKSPVIPLLLLFPSAMYILNNENIIKDKKYSFNIYTASIFAILIYFHLLPKNKVALGIFKGADGLLLAVLTVAVIYFTANTTLAVFKNTKHKYLTNSLFVCALGLITVSMLYLMA